MKLFGRSHPSSPPRRRHTPGQLEEEGAKFRRSATLTGTLSDDVKATAETRGQLQSSRLEAQTKRRVQRRWGRRLALAVGVMIVLMVIWSNRIVGYEVGFANQPSHSPAVQPYIQTAMAFRGTKFANRFAPTLHIHQLQSQLIASHKEVAAVTVRRSFFTGRPQLQITLRQPVLLWQTARDNHAFYVDASGVTFSQNGYGNDAKLVKVNDESGVPTELGSPVASSRQIRFLGQLVGQVATSSQNSLSIVRIVFPPSSTKEMDIFLANKPYFAKVYLERPPRAQADEIVQGVNYFNAKGIIPAEYIDVRVAEKVFYK